MSNVLEYLLRKGFDYKQQGKEYVLDTCPVCRDSKKHFYISEEGLWKCHKCGEQGNLYQLKKQMGDILEPTRCGTQIKRRAKPLKKDIEENHKKFLNSEATINWMKVTRGLNIETVRLFKLIIEGSKLGFPYYQDGLLVGIKWRTKDKQITREKGCDSTLYNIDNLKPDKPVILVEGEFDVMAAVQMGFANVISGCNGAGSFAEEWVKEFAEVPDIYLAYDNDKAGEEGAMKVSAMLGRWRCRRVYLPFKDFNDCLINGVPKEDIEKCLADATPYKDNAFVHAVDLITRVRDDMRNPAKQGVKIGWKHFDKFLGGVRPGEVTTVTGDTAVGKTTFITNLAYKLLEQGIIFVSTETTPEKIMRKLYSIHSGNMIDGKTTDAALVPVEMFICGKNLFFLDVYGEVNFDRIEETLEYARRYGVKIAMLDHLHFFLTSKSLDNDRIEIERFMRSLVKLARETEMHIFLVCHPAKMWEPQEGDPPIVKPNNLKGSAAIKQDSHNIMSLWRNPALQTGTAILYIQKVRDDAGFAGNIKFSFDYKSQRYREVVSDGGI